MSTAKSLNLSFETLAIKNEIPLSQWALAKPYVITFSDLVNPTFSRARSLTFTQHSDKITAMADTSIAEPQAPVSTKSPENPASNTEDMAVATTGAADDTPQGDQQLQSVKKTKIIRRKKRPARIQVDPSTMKTEPAQQPGMDYNIWYNKSGDNEDKYGLSNPAPGRCNIARDSGYTRADRIPGSFFW